MEKLEYNEKAAMLFKKASDKGYAKGSMYYGYMLSFIKPDKTEPSKYMRIGIRSRDPDSLSLAGALLINDDNCLANDVGLGTMYLMLAVKKGCAEAAGLLGHFFHLEGDKSDAFTSYYYKKAIKEGHVEAIFWYSCFLLDPNNSFFDLQKGVEMCKLSIEKGNSDAMCAYAGYLLSGMSRECSPEEAIKYYKMAIDIGNESAMVEYADLIITSLQLLKEI